MLLLFVASLDKRNAKCVFDFVFFLVFFGFFLRRRIKPSGCSFPQDLCAAVCGVQGSTAQPTHDGGRVGRGVAGTEEEEEEEVLGSRQAKVHPQQADWSSKVERSTRRQTRYLLPSVRKNIGSVDFGAVVCSQERRVCIIRQTQVLFLQPDSFCVPRLPPFFQSSFIFFPPVISSPENSLACYSKLSWADKFLTSYPSLGCGELTA